MHQSIEFPDAGPTLSDPRRLAILERTGLLDTPPEEPYDRLTRIASKLLRSHGAALSLVTDSRQFYKSAIGIEARETPLSHSFSQYIVGSNAPLAVPDARDDHRLRRSPLVTDLGIIAFCGVPVYAAGQPIGSLCAISSEPREWSSDDISMLQDVAQLANLEIADRLTRRLQDEQRGRFLWFMNLLPIAVYSCDQHGNLTYYNNKAASLWECRPQMGEPESAAFAALGAAIDGVEAGPASLPAASVMTRGTSISNLEMDLGQKTTLVSAEAITDPAGGQQGAVVVMHDVTAIRQATRLRDELLSLVSHELRTPLTVINGMSLLLQRRWEFLDSEDRDSVVQDMVTAGRRMERSVENMLVLSHLQHDLAEPEPLLMRRVFDEVLVEHYKDFPQSRINVVVKDPAPVAMGIGPWVRLIIGNLLSNAEHFGDLTEPHLLEAEATGNGSIKVRVCDSGPALTPEEYETIFDPFYRRPATSIRVPGAGLGLTVARRLAEAQGGKLVAGPRPDKEGTLLTLTLPAVSPQEWLK